jgi:hypothetical protein
MILLSGLAVGGHAQPIPSTRETVSDAVEWLYLTPDCGPKPGDVTSTGGEPPQVVSCGATGFFVLGKPGLVYQGKCRSDVGGIETPAGIPTEPAPSYPSTLPCAQGVRCSHHTPGHPWVAVVDWPTEHGWSVAATIREASDQKVETELYDLTAAGTLSQWEVPVSDAHVLIQLCAVAEAVKQHPDDRPLAVNMSFGRLATKASCGESGPTLGCAIGQVLSGLATQGVIPIAAAGNHQEMLFPASSPDVISAGALDLSWFEQYQEARPSAQTPTDAAALMLGYGLYLSADGKAPYWAAPPGSSYAAALLSGWLGGTLAGGGQIPGSASLRGARWTPLLTPGTQDLALALNGVQLQGSHLNGPRLLLGRAMAGPGRNYAPAEGVTLAFQGPAPPPPQERSLLHADDENGPQPGVDPCVPCGPGPPAGREEAGQDLTLDLSSSGGLPPQMDLLAVFLRVGGEIYGFEGSRDPSLLAAMAAGSLESLTFSGVGGILRPDEQPSLHLVVAVGDSLYWHEVPITPPLLTPPVP